MLRRRIFASAMASVMALTSVAVVASADETATAVNYVKTKADLEEYVKSFDSFRTNELYDYGSTSNDNFNKALDFAQNILDDPESTVDDYTVGYMTLKTVYDHLAIYTADQLKTLIDSCKKIYETNNLFSEELDDEIYKNEKNDGETWATYDEFVSAYEDAEAVVNSSDTRIITDAYETLNWAKTTMKPWDTVTKAQFRSALKAYETALQKEYNYETWATGQMVDTTGAISWAFSDIDYAWGVVYNAAASQQASIKANYKELDETKNVSKRSKDAIVTAYKNCLNYAAAINAFVENTSVRGSESSVKALINKYHGLLVNDYATTAAEKLFAAVETAVKAKDTGKKDKDGNKIYGTMKVEQYNDATFSFTEDYTTPWAVQKGMMHRVNAEPGMSPEFDELTEVWKKTYAGITVQPTVAVWIKTGEDGYAEADADGNYTVVTSDPGKGYAKINKGSKKDLTSLIKVTAADITSGVDNHELNYVFDGDNYAVRNGYWYVDTDTGLNRPVAGSWVLSYTNYAWDNSNDGHHISSQGQDTYAYAELDKAMALAEFYLGAKKDEFADQDKTLNADNSIYDISTTGKFAAGTAKGSSQEWAVVYNYLARALSDKYDATTSTYTKSDVVKLIDECYELAEKTGDSAMFKYSHNTLVTYRQEALDWVKAANKDKKYSENVSAYKFFGGNMVASQVYTELKKKYDKLNADFGAFKYSYGDMYNKIAEIADLIDSEEIVATEAITSGMSDVLYRLFVLRSLDEAVDEELDNDVFTTDVYFQHNNRVYTHNEIYRGFKIGDAASDVVTFPKPDSNTANITWEHNELAKAYETLVAAVKAQTDPAVVLGDVDGDGKVTAADASEILKAVVGMRDPIANEVGDFNGDGAVTAADASAILRSVIGL